MKQSTIEIADQGLPCELCFQVMPIFRFLDEDGGRTPWIMGCQNRLCKEHEYGTLFRTYEKVDLDPISSLDKNKLVLLSDDEKLAFAARLTGLPPRDST